MPRFDDAGGLGGCVGAQMKAHQEGADKLARQDRRSIVRLGEEALVVLAETGWAVSTVVVLLLSRRPRLMRKFKDGIPSTMRRQWWVYLAWTSNPTPKSILDRRPFLDLLGHRTNIRPALETTGLDGEILRDLDRTFPTEPFFYPTADGTRLLANVLKALSVQLPAVGYVQGMNFVAAKLLLLWQNDHFQRHRLDEDVFSLLTGIVHRHSSLWSPGMPGLRRCIFALQKLMEKHLPALHGHLRRIGMHAGYFATQWFVTLFSRILPLDSFACVWDRFLTDGLKMLFRVALVILTYMQTDLLAMDMEEASMYFCRNPKLHVETMPSARLICEAMAFKVTRARLRAVEDERQVDLLHFRLEADKNMDAAVFFPEVEVVADDGNDLAAIRSELHGLDSGVKQDVAVFRQKIERIHRAADAAAATYLVATAQMMEASYRLQELTEWSSWNDMPDEEAASPPPWYLRVFACFEAHPHAAHARLRDEDGQQQHEKHVEEYEARREALMLAAVEMEEATTYKAKMTEQFLAVLAASEQSKTALLKARFDALDHTHQPLDKYATDSE
ncbi:Aste57867_8570 [Aphanomyces stellatus]|uniref:Aste57867_8570 protein n=1 Tax=Aphanomyces stellatus TaxID=120398 RepID=A0A485KKL4_9STRA|nr:hypothetical protein As57867_008538 [Aphanomyces stellatus]VFT85456.1 Aste57867_8570 [Aphanomyces stellatus]